MSKNEYLLLARKKLPFINEDKTRVSKNEVVLSINSFLLAVIICAEFIALVFAALGIISDGLLPVIFISALVVSYSMNFLTLPKSIRINIKSMIFILLIIMLFIITFSFKGFATTAKEYFIEFMAYGGIVYLIALLPFSPYKVIRYSMLLGIVFLINPIKIISFTSINTITSYERITMGASYAILPILTATILHFCFFYDKANFLDKIAYICNTILLVVLFTRGTRGAVLSILILIFLILYLKISKLAGRNKYFISMIFLLVALGVILLILTNLKNIILNLYLFLQSIGIEIAALIKTYNFIEEEGIVAILNGRDSIYIRSLELFLQSPIWGHGIGIYGDIYGTYPHNLFLQILTEGGIILFIPIATIIIECVKLLLKPWSRNNLYEDWRYLLLFLFIIAIPRLMFSSYLWQEQSFWLMVFVYFLTKNKDVRCELKHNV